jgi:hypothetical protein
VTWTRWIVVGIALLVVPWYLAVGIGYERLQQAC